MVKKTAEDFEELGRRLDNIYLTGYISKTEMMKWSFLKGVMAGFGGVIGATIVVAIIFGILSMFETVPLIGPVVEKLENTVNQAK